jgi:hypothetical protein
MAFSIGGDRNIHLFPLGGNRIERRLAATRLGKARLADLPKYYWDACAWIALIQKEADRFDPLSYVIEEAKAKRCEIWTSAFTLAEVYKRACDGEQKSLLPTNPPRFCAACSS